MFLCPSRPLWRRAWQDRVSQNNIGPARPRPQRARPRPRPIFWSQTGLVLRPTVSDHITTRSKRSFSSTSCVPTTTTTMITMMLMLMLSGPGRKPSQTPLSGFVTWRKSCVLLSFSSEWNCISITWSSDVTSFVPCKMAPQCRWRPSVKKYKRVNCLMSIYLSI